MPVEFFFDVGRWTAGAGGEVYVDVVCDSGVKDFREDERGEGAGGDGLEEGKLVDPAYREYVLDFLAEKLGPPGMRVSLGCT